MWKSLIDTGPGDLPGPSHLEVSQIEAVERATDSRLSDLLKEIDLEALCVFDDRIAPLTKNNRSEFWIKNL